MSTATTLVPGIVKLNSAEVAAIRSQHQTAVTTSAAAASTASGTTIQTFQITTSTGVQTIRVAAPPNLPTALLARTLQLSAQQHQAMQQGHKITFHTSAAAASSSSSSATTSAAALNGANAAIKQVPTRPRLG